MTRFWTGVTIVALAVATLLASSITLGPSTSRNTNPVGSTTTSSTTTSSTTTSSTTTSSTTTTTLAVNTSAGNDLLTTTDIAAHAVGPLKTYSHSDSGWGSLVSFDTFVADPSSSAGFPPGICQNSESQSVKIPSLESELDHRYFTDGYLSNLYREFGSAISQFSTVADATADFQLIADSAVICGYTHRTEALGNQTIAMSTTVPTNQPSTMFLDRVFIQLNNSIVQVITRTDESDHTAIADQMAAAVLQRWKSS